MISQAITKNSILLGVFAIAVAASLAGTELMTRELREESIRKVQSQALEEIVPADRHDNILLDDILAVNDKEYLKLKEPKNIHVARKEGKVVAFIFPVRAPDGYSGAVDSIVGINLDGTLAGVRIIQHKETPGLGDKVELKKSNWVLSFAGKSLLNPSSAQWKVKKDKGIFDQFTGATITPRAVVNSVHNALIYFDKHKEELLQQANPLPEKENSESVNSEEAENGNL
jgi:electron transport complex protein RnfG